MATTVVTKSSVKLDGGQKASTGGTGTISITVTPSASQYAIISAYYTDKAGTIDIGGLQVAVGAVGLVIVPAGIMIPPSTTWSLSSTDGAAHTVGVVFTLFANS